MDGTGRVEQGRWEVREPAGPGTLHLVRPYSTLKYKVRMSVLLAVLVSIFLAVAWGGWPRHGEPLSEWLHVPMVLVTVGLMVGMVWRAARKEILNVVHLQAADGRLVLQDGPYPRLQQHAVQLEWIARVEPRLPPASHIPVLDLHLRNGDVQVFPLGGCSDAETRYAAEQVRGALQRGQAGGA